MEEKKNDTSLEITPESGASIPSEPIAPLQTLGTDIDKYVASTISPEERRQMESLKTRVSPAGPAPGTGLPPPPPPGGVELQAVVLPTKVVHSPLNAQRTSASTLVAQEAAATLPKTPAPPTPSIHKPQPAVPPLQTYQDDMQKYVAKEHVSAVTVAAAEEQRRVANNAPIVITKGTSRSKIAMIMGGIIMLGAAAGALAFIYYTHAPLPAQQAPLAPFITVDQTTPVLLAVGNTRGDIMRLIQNGSQNTQLASGLIGQLVPLVATTSGHVPLDAQTFFGVFTPNMPSNLLRTLRSNYFVGVHSLTGNQPLIILNTDSYEGGYAGMLAWESTMQLDLSPFFPITVPPPTPVATTSASTTEPTTSVPSVISSGFVDTVISNHDARVIYDYAHRIELVWTFLDRNTILITANPSTVTEVISRLKHSSTLVVPGQ
jgi:hypothetical protein